VPNAGVAMTSPTYYPMLIDKESGQKLLSHLGTIQRLIPWTTDEKQADDMNDAVQKFFDVWTEIQVRSEQVGTLKSCETCQNTLCEFCVFKEGRKPI
jgi:hypothetical protein